MAHLTGIDGSLTGLRIVLDCANGATFEAAPAVFRALGADVVVIHAGPNGRNINDDCGATNTASLAEAVVAHKADVGLAFDGGLVFSRAYFAKLNICYSDGNNVPPLRGYR